MLILTFLYMSPGIHVQTFSQGIYLGMKLLTHNKCLLSTLLEMPCRVSQWLFCFFFYPQYKDILVTSHSCLLALLFCVLLKNFRQRSAYEMVSYCGLLQRFGTPFLKCVGHPGCLICWVPVQVFCQFCIEVSFSYLFIGVLFFSSGY